MIIFDFMGKKKHLSELRQASAMIPAYLQPTKVLMSGKELRNKGIKDENGQDPHPDKTYLVSTQVPKNHYRQLKKNFKKGGMKMVNEYIHEMLEVNMRAIVTTDTITNGLADRQSAITSGF